ncbi:MULTISPECIES: restriction endonuclease subunit S [unclassified Pseudomonas]|uniref:restriction endonuclease subunit S n=1 Tax=unclassified Pseudomonas TaxID=196821 RepID=UPI002361977D|nr:MULTISPECIES: restriction endonuclease subunit S [unclassified Pseudomonas]
MKPYASYKPSAVPWLGEVPAHWAGKRLRDCVEGCSNGVWGDDPDGGDDDIPVIRVADFDRPGRQVVEYGTLRKVDSGQRGSRALVPGDMLIEKSGGGEQQPVGMVVSYFGPEGAVCSNFVARMRSREGVVSRFMVYLHAYLYASRVTNISVKQTTGIQNLDSTAYLSEACFVPPPDEQQVIADYLDRETARIDTLIHEKDELIGLLREWRRSVIAEYTSGATQLQGKKATGNVHMPWIPSDWSMVRLGKYARIGNGSTPLKDNASYWDGGTFPWLNSAVVNRDTVDEGSEYVTDGALRACHLPIVEPGALLVALTGQGKTRGQVTVLRIQATINQHLAYLALDEARFDANFLFWALTGMYAALRMVSDGQGGTKGALTCDDLARFEVPMPSLTVQQEIASAVSRETAKIDDLIAHTHDEITLLRELRAATIADAVLGRIDVRCVAKTIAACA